MDKKYKVYVHINKVNGKRYFGTTCQKLNRRFRTGGKGYILEKRFYKEILEYGWDNFEHIVLYENLTKEEAYKKEIELIAKYDTTNELKGYNVSTGGEWFNGIRGRKGKDNPFYGKHHTAESIAKYKARPKERYYMYGKKHKKETIEKMKEKAKGANNSNATKIIQYTLDYVFIKEWECMSDVEKELGIKHSSIGNCCNRNADGRIKKCKAKGFIWEYADKPKQRKKVIQK